MKKQYNPFETLSCRYGSPMGRHGDNLSKFQGVKRIHARHQGGAMDMTKAVHTGATLQTFGAFGIVKAGNYALHIFAHHHGRRLLKQHEKGARHDCSIFFRMRTCHRHGARCITN